MWIAGPVRNIVIYRPMQNKNTISLHLILIAATFLIACSGNQRQQYQPGNPIGSMDRETFDLADVTADALSLAEQAGADQLLVVLDIDNTILAMEQGLGADQWYEWQKSLGESDLCDPDNVGNPLAVQGALYFVSAMRSTQADGAAQVRAIQDRGIPVFSLTSRGPEFRLQTFRELRRNNFSFTYSSPGPQGGYEEPFMPVDNGRMSRYEDGVFLTAGQHKGKMLFALLKKTGTKLPAVIIVADDKQKNLDAIKETFSTLDVPVHAWRYAGEDENVRTFDPELAATQWNEINEPLQRIQQEMGPDNYDLSSAVRPVECP